MQGLGLEISEPGIENKKKSIRPSLVEAIYEIFNANSTR
jgi:hypothetical protein